MSSWVLPLIAIAILMMVCDRRQLRLIGIMSAGAFAVTLLSLALMR